MPACLQKLIKWILISIGVLLSGHSDLDTAKEAIETGKVFKILTKPYPMDELVAVLKQCVEEFKKNKESRALTENGK